MPPSTENYDNMPSRSTDVGQLAQHPSRRVSDNTYGPTGNMQYPDPTTSYHSYPNPSYQTHQSFAYNAHQQNSSLPPIRDMRSERYNGRFDPDLSMHSPYPDAFAYGLSNGYEAENGHYASRRPPIYDQSQRTHQIYSEMSNGGGMMGPGQARYLPSFDPSRGPAPYSGRYMEPEVPSSAVNGTSYPNFGVLGDAGDSRSKKRRGNLPKPVTDILRAWFHEHLDHPYPSEDDKQMLINRTGLTISQVCQVGL